MNIVPKIVIDIIEMIKEWKIRISKNDKWTKNFTPPTEELR